MSAAAPMSQHELDDRLANANMFAWYGPAFGLVFKHWPISLVASLVAAAVNQAFFFSLTLLGFIPVLSWVQTGSTLFNSLAYMAIVAVAYRFVAQRENVGTVNEWGVLIVRALLITLIWVVAAALVAGAVALAVVAVGFGVLDDLNDLGTLIVLAGIALLAAFLLMPVWFSLAVANALSVVYAVRSAEGPFGAIAASLRLAFGQKWRVFWPSYLIAILAAVLFWVVASLQSVFFGFGVVLALLMTFFTTSLGIMMTFVIERAYAPHLTMPEGAEAGAELPSRPKPGSVPPPRERPAAAPAAPLPTAPSEIAELLAADMAAHRVQRVVETVEAGLAADVRFFVGQPDHTLAVGKRLASVQRSDLALRLMQPYLKEHREHRQHLTVALYVANLLRDMQRAPDAARFLAQVKTLYPNEPMVDQLIKITNKALAADGAPDAT